MTKINLDDFSTLTNEASAINKLNLNNLEIENKSETFLSRDGVTPNHMLADLDMNSNDILNVGNITVVPGGRITGLSDAISDDEPITMAQLEQLLGLSLGAPFTTAIVFVIDAGAAPLTTGVKGDLGVPFNCTINSVQLLADQTGSIVVDIWKDSYGSYPPTVADKITASAPPTISATNKYSDTTLTGWSTSISAGDTLRYNVNSVTTIQRVAVVLKVTKT